MELEQRIIIRFLHREHAEPQDIHARLSGQFDAAAESLRSVQRWCQYIQQGHELLDDKPRSGRLSITFLDIQIPSSLQKHPFHSAYSFAQILDVSHTTILNHLYDSFGMKLFHLCWISNQLTEQLGTSRIQKYQELLPLLEGMEANEFRNIRTSDENFLMLEYQHIVKWILSRRCTRKSEIADRHKRIYVHCYLGVNGFHVVDLMTSQRSFDSEYFVSQALAPMAAKVFAGENSTYSSIATSLG